MKVRLLTVSHRPPGWVVDGCAEYARRLPRTWNFELVEIRPEPRKDGASTGRVQATEAERLRAAIPHGARVVALDERGEAWSTAEFAARLQRWLQDARDLAFLVGGADGLDPTLRDAADHRLALSALTLPHGLVRVLFVEQLYRAATLLQGHPYHR
ncbi:MAG: 23S rRNA (pseudouridine(1915)-N(3))-methyltransferase RlmH [Planctomycetes bacterium]|nr:23S rRNA (pseudouridine(1915)-N(3))-methyltransferase RlmH [Planctomycetota bacterium]